MTPKQKALEMLARAVDGVRDGTPLSVAQAWIGEAATAVALIDERIDGRKHKKKGGPLDDPNVTR